MHTMTPEERQRAESEAKKIQDFAHSLGYDRYCFMGLKSVDGKASVSTHSYAELPEIITMLHVFTQELNRTSEEAAADHAAGFVMPEPEHLV